MKSLAEEWRFVAGSKFLIAIFIGPLIAALFFGLMFSKNQISKSPIIVIDEDHSAYSRQLISKMNASQYMKVTNIFASRMNPDTLLANEQAVAVIMLPNQLEQRKLHGKSSNIGYTDQLSLVSIVPGHGNPVDTACVPNVFSGYRLGVADELA